MALVRQILFSVETDVSRLATMAVLAAGLNVSYVSTAEGVATVMVVSTGMITATDSKSMSLFKFKALTDRRPLVGSRMIDDFVVLSRPNFRIGRATELELTSKLA